MDVLRINKDVAQSGIEGLKMGISRFRVGLAKMNPKDEVLWARVDSLVSEAYTWLGKAYDQLNEP